MAKLHGYKITTKNKYSDSVNFLQAENKKEALRIYSLHRHTDETTIVESVPRKEMVKRGFSEYY